MWENLKYQNVQVANKYLLRSSVPSTEEFKEAIVVFENPSSVDTALLLNHAYICGSAIEVSVIIEEDQHVVVGNSQTNEANPNPQEAWADATKQPTSSDTQPKVTQDTNQPERRVSILFSVL